MWVANPNLRILKRLAIIMPVTFLVAWDLLRHSALGEFHHPAPDFLVNHGITASVVVLFAYLIFGLTGRLQSRFNSTTRSAPGLAMS